MNCNRKDILIDSNLILKLKLYGKTECYQIFEAVAQLYQLLFFWEKKKDKIILWTGIFDSLVFLPKTHCIAT